jgi:hypothetical protein
MLGLRRHLVFFGALLAALPLLLASSSETRKTFYWARTGSTMSRIEMRDASLAEDLFDNRHALAIGDEDGVQNQVIPGYASMPALKYESYARFHSDIQDGRIHSSITTVLYDPEAWPATPNAERRDPKRYLRQFAKLAHRHGYVVINTPSRDLMNLRFAYCRKRRGETLSDAYLRCEIAAEAARDADGLVIQSQADERDSQRYRRFVEAAAAQARAANPNVIVLSALATSPSGIRVTARTLRAAHDAVDDLVDGHLLTVNANEDEIAADFLTMVRAAEE